MEKFARLSRRAFFLSYPTKNASKKRSFQKGRSKGILEEKVQMKQADNNESVYKLLVLDYGL
jgi:hypothetical protein